MTVVRTATASRFRFVPCVLAACIVGPHVAFAQGASSGEPAAWRDPATGTLHRGTDAWVALFKHKRAQLDALRCGEAVAAPGRQARAGAVGTQRCEAASQSFQP